jgi:hypothetical protein
MTSARWWAAGLAAAALALYAAAALPLQRQAAAAADEYRRARDEARDTRARLARLERRELAHARAVAVGAGTPGETVRTVRRAVVRSLEGAPVSGVRLGVTPSRGPFAARMRLSAEGAFSDVVALTGAVSRPENGVVLDRVRLVPRQDRLGLEVDAVTLRAGGEAAAR